MSFFAKFLIVLVRLWKVVLNKKPGKPTVLFKATREFKMAKVSMIEYAGTVTSPSGDVESWTAIVSAVGANVSVSDLQLAGELGDPIVFAVEQDSEVSVSIVVIDDAGLKSDPPAVVTFVAKDTIRPELPNVSFVASREFFQEI